MTDQVRARLLGLCLSVFLAGVAPLASAHLMPANRGTLNLVDDKAYMVVSLPVASFQSHVGGPEVRGGSITSAFFASKQEAFREAVREGLVLKSPAYTANFTTVMLSLPTGYGHDPNRSEELIVMATGPFAQPPEDIILRSSLWHPEAKPVKIKTTLTKNKKTVQEEVGTLTSDAPSHVFFSTPAYVFQRSLLSGTKHLLLGLDHIVFLLLTLAVLGTRRRRLGSMAAFSASAAMAMFGAALGWLSPPALWVELGIAVSVLLVATLHGLKAMERSWGVLWIAGLGVLHGWGFVQVQELGTHLPLVKTAGFALGVTAGACVLGVCVVLVQALASQKLTDAQRLRVVHVCILAACICASVWCVERVSALIG